MKGKLRRILSLVLAVMLVAGMVQMPAKTVRAEGTPEFTARFVDESGNTITSAEPGQKIKLIVSVSNAQRVSAFEVTASYDEDILADKEEEFGNFTDEFYDYGDSMPSRQFIVISTANVSLAGGMKLIYAASPIGSSTKLPPDLNDMDVAYTEITVAEDFEGEVPVSVTLNKYEIDCEKTFVGGTTSTTLTVKKQPVPITDFELNTNSLSLDLSDAEKTTGQLSVASYSPENTTDRTVTWSSNDENVAKVDQNGLVTAVGKGTANVTASIKSANGTTITKDCTVTVGKSVTGVTLSASSMNLKNGQSRQLTATVAPSDADNASVEWSTSDDKVATVDENGNVKAVTNSGTAVITATTPNGKSAQCVVTVATVNLNSIKLSKDSVKLAKGEDDSLSVLYDPDLSQVTDDLSDVTWASSDEDVVKVDQNGKITAAGAGTATVTAKLTAEGKEFEASCDVEVYVPVTGITVTPAALELLKGASQTVSVALEPADVDTYDLKWTVDNAHVSIEADGTTGKTCKITGVSEGTSIVTVTDANTGKKAFVAVTVKEIPVNEVEIAVEKTTLNKGDSVQASAKVLPENTTDDKKTVTWSSDNKNVVTVDQDGKITAVGGGTTVIRATSDDRTDVVGTVEITVTVPLKEISIADAGQALQLKKGQSSQLEVSYAPADTTDEKAVTWSSSDETIASVDENGTVTAKKEGTVTITATSKANKEITASREVKVTEIKVNEAALDPANITLPLSQGTFAEKVILKGADDQDVSGTTTDEFTYAWSTSNASVATVDEEGIVTLVGAGTATITLTMTRAEDGKVFVADSEITVVIPMTGLQISRDGQDVTGNTMQLVKGESLNLSAQAVPQNTTDSYTVEWKSSNPEAVKVDGNGTATSLTESEEPVTITAVAKVGEKEITASVQISAVEIHIDSIQLDPEEVTLEKGESTQLGVTFLPENTTDEKIIKTWSSSDPQAVSVDENGVITAVGQSSATQATITAVTANGKTASCKVNVRIHIEGISVVDKNVELLYGKETKKLSEIGVNFSPANTTDDRTLNYEITDGTDVAEIITDENGELVISGLKKGTATVMVSAVNAAGGPKTDTFQVTIKENHLEKEDLAPVVSEQLSKQEDGSYALRANEKNPQIQVTYDDSNITDDVEIVYSVDSACAQYVSIDPKSGVLTILSVPEDPENTKITVYADVTATAADGSANTFRETFELTMVVVPLESIAFDKDSQNVTMTEGTERELNIVFNPTDTTDTNLTWTTSDPSIVTITQTEDGKAVVKALKEGTVTVKAVSEGGLEAETTVIVTKKADPQKPGTGTTNTTDNKDGKGGKTQKSTAVKTGDTAQPVVYVVTALLALAAILLLIRRKVTRF